MRGNRAKIIFIFVIIALTVFTAMSYPTDAIRLIIVENSHPSYASPITDLSYNVTLAGYRTRYPLLRLQQKMELRENTQSANKLIGFAQSVQGLNVYFLRTVTIIDGSGHLILNKTVASTDLGDKRMDVYVNTNEIVGQITITHSLYLSITYDYQNTQFSFSRTFSRTKNVNLASIGTEAQPTVAEMEES